MSKNKVTEVFLFTRKLIVHARPSHGNHIDAALEAQGLESSPGSIGDTVMHSPVPLVEPVECQECDLFEVPVEATRARLWELARFTARKVSSGFVCVIMGSWTMSGQLRMHS